MYNPPHGIRIGSPEGQARKTHAELGSAVQAVLKGQELASSGIERRQQGSAFVGLTAAATEKASAQITRQDFGQLFGKINNGFGQVNRSGVLQGFDLPAYSLGNLRVTVPECMDTHAGIEVHVFLPGRVV